MRGVEGACMTYLGRIRRIHPRNAAEYGAAATAKTAVNAEAPDPPLFALVRTCAESLRRGAPSHFGGHLFLR